MQYKRFVPYTTLALLAALASPCVATGATVFRTYLSSRGNDGNACSLAAPCRLLPAALAQTQDGGEVWMLDSANYNTGTVTLARSVTILAVPSALGSLVTTDTNAIEISAPGISVTLRNISVLALSGSNRIGIYVTGAHTRLTVDDSEFRNLGEAIGIFEAAGAQMNIIHTTFLDNIAGITLFGTTDAPANGAVTHCTFVGPGIVDSNSYNAAISTLYSSATISHSRISNFGYATISSSSSTLVLNDNTIAHNRWVGYIEGTASLTHVTGNNTLFNNATEMRNGSLTPATNQ